MGCGTRPFSIGSRRRRVEWTEHVAVASVLVHVRFCVAGGNIVSCERVRNCSHVTGLCVSQQCQLRIGRCVKPCALNSLPCYWISCRFYIEREDKKFKNVLAEKFFSLKSSSLLNHALFFKYFNIFLFNRFGLSTSVFTETSDFISQLTLFKSDFFQFGKQGEALPFFS